MGRGCGPLSGRMTLNTLQRRLGNSFLRVDSTGDVYTFVRSCNLDEDLEVVFELNDQLIINEGVTLTVEGKMDITENTNNIIRIRVLGVLNIESTSHLEFGDIELVDPVDLETLTCGLLIDGNLNLNNGKITFKSIKNSAIGIGLIFNGNIITNGGHIEFETISGIYKNNEITTCGIMILGDYLNTVNNIYFNKLNLQINLISESGFGIGIYEAQNFNFFITESNITINEIIGMGSNPAQSIGLAIGAEFNNKFICENSVITIGKLSNAALGMGFYNANITNKKDIIFNEINSNSTAILFEADSSTLENEENATIKVLAGDNNNTTGFKIDTTTPSLITNLGPDGAIDMSNTTTPYSPALTDPLDAPWNGGDTPTRSFYAP